MSVDKEDFVEKEVTDYTERRLSGCHYIADTSYSRRKSRIESIPQALMQQAKKLVIVDPRLLDQLQVDREYKHTPRPADTLAKTLPSLDISSILPDESISKDVKARQYQDALRRYHNVRSTIPQEIKTEPNPIHQPPPPPQPLPRRRRSPPPLPHIPSLRRQPKRERRHSVVEN